jgi:FkbM family methyltransferase
MLRRIQKLLDQPAFKAEPLAVLGRAGVWSASVALRRSPVFRLTRGGERLRVPSDFRYTSVSAFLLRDWTEPELRELDQLLSPGEVFIDVGANIGLYALKAARLVGPRGRVLALEPGQAAGDQLEANLALNDFGWVDLVRKAASDVDGRAVLHHVELGNDPQAFSLIENLSAGERGETVETVRLDTLVGAMALSRIDLVKIDVEGAEPMVIAGARECLARFKPAVIFECNAYLNAGGDTGAAARAWGLLAELGYGFQRLAGGRFSPIDRPPDDFCNVLAVHPAA